MNLPKFHETFNPILKILQDGSILHHREMINKVIENNYIQLPKDLLEQKTKSGDILINNRITWGEIIFKKSRLYSLSGKRNGSDHKKRA